MPYTVTEKTKDCPICDEGYVCEQDELGSKGHRMRDGRFRHCYQRELKSFLKFNKLMHVNKSRKTSIWEVVSQNGGVIGKVQWFTPWRRYVFAITWLELGPAREIVFDVDCLREVQSFIAEQMYQHAQTRASTRASKIVM